jgi:hypothetical protein
MELPGYTLTGNAWLRIKRKQRSFRVINASSGEYTLVSYDALNTRSFVKRNQVSPPYSVIYNVSSTFIQIIVIKTI